MNFAGEDLVVDVELMPLGTAYAELGGLITDDVTGSPLADVLVEIVGLTSTETGPDGYYLISDIPPGTYVVRFSHPQYETIEFS